MAQDRLDRLRSLIEADPEAARELIAKLNNKLLIPHDGGQEDVIAASERFLILCAGRRWGKMARDSEPIPTPHGFKLNGELEVGDFVLGRNGAPTKVTGVYPQGFKDIYEVELSDGSKTYVGAEHLWEVHKKTRKGRSPEYISEIKETQELIDDLTLDRPDGQLEYKWRIPFIEPAQHTEKEYPLEPYTVGALLGDGSTQYACSITTADPEIFEYLDPQITKITHYGRYSYGLSGISKQLNELNVRKRCEFKEVPEEYMVGDIHQRTELLQGLLDTDGHADSAGRVEFSSASEQLALQVQQLINSLGGTASLWRKETTHLPAYRVRGRLPESIQPFRLTRKIKAYKPRPLRKKRIIGIRFSHQEHATCISVDAPDALYLAGKAYIPTHNTKIGAKRALSVCRRQRKMVWWVAPTYRVVKRGYAEVLAQLPDNVLAKPAPSEGSFDAGRPVVLHFKNGTKFEFHSAERPEGMLGAAVDFVILDEAATMPRNTWEQIIMPTLADHQGGALLISTPRGRNWFYEMYQRGQDKLQPEFKSWVFPSMTNPTIPREEWELQRQSLPAVVYEQEILADFVSNAAAVFRFDENDVVYDLAPPNSAVVMGIDLAKHQDFTVLDAVNVNDRQPCYHDRFNAVSWPEQRARIARAVKKLKQNGATNVTLVVDSTGVGDPIVDDLELMGYEVVGVKFTQQWKQQAVMLLSSDLEQGHAFLHEAQLPEFQSYTYTITDAGRWTFSAPGGGHDDEVSAKLLQHWEVAKGGSPNMAVISSESIQTAHVNEWDQEIVIDEEYWEYQESELDKIKDEEIHPRSTTDLLNDPAVWK